MIRGQSSRINYLTLAILVCLAGCAQLKGCAYQGINRDAWQQPQRVLESLKIAPGMIVADVGAGGGYFTFKLARAVGPSGKVYAVDVDREMIDLITDRAREENAANIATIVGAADDPRLPASGVDLIFTANTYHHIENRVRYFANLRKYLRPGGRIAVIDFDRRGWLEGLLRHYTPKEFIQREMEQAGFVMQQDLEFLDRQSFLIFAPAQ
jgi:ubiquinone/menaquinone biosynthesis C-methylase UbiE